MHVFRILINRLLQFIFLETVPLLYVLNKILHKMPFSLIFNFYWIKKFTFWKKLKSKFRNLFKWILRRMFCFKFCFVLIKLHMTDWKKWWGIDHSFVLMVVSHPYEWKESFYNILSLVYCQLKRFCCTFCRNLIILFIVPAGLHWSASRHKMALFKCRE